MGDTEEDCQNNVTDTVSLMTDLGFIIHEKKSVLVPTRTITFLGNNIDSEKMLVTLPVEKVCLIVQECRELYKRQYVKIRTVARVLGLMVSTFSAVEFAPLYYRIIEKGKILALKSSQGNFDSTMFISDEMRSELKWWIDNLATQKRHISHGNANLTIITDASSFGWGAICKGNRVGGRWNDQESQYHINYLELLAVSHALKIFCKSAENIHVQIKTDNSCTVSYLNKMGGVRSEQCDSLAKQIWKWCINRSIWLSASHIPGIDNEADFESRNFKDNVEWKLSSRIFHTITEIWGLPDVDMFASRLNIQVDRFVSWHLDPDCIAVDAFSLTWSDELIYAFPPFSLIGRLVQKLRQDQGDQFG